MKYAIVIALLTASVSAHAITAFLVDEYITGQTKQCIYEALGNKYTRTVSATQLCPMSIEV